MSDVHLPPADALEPRRAVPFKILRAYPPNFRSIRERFPIAGRTGIVFAYGDTVYNPSGRELDPPLLAHEFTHCERQSGDEVNAEMWWGYYLSSRDFRLREEAMAYARQHSEFVRTHLSRFHDAYLSILSEQLASKIYLLGINAVSARQEITRYVV